MQFSLFGGAKIGASATPVLRSPQFCVSRVHEEKNAWNLRKALYYGNACYAGYSLGRLKGFWDPQLNIETLLISWSNEWMNKQWKNEGKSEWTNERTYERTNEQIDKYNAPLLRQVAFDLR